MAKRFPVPEFDYAPFKGLEWSTPVYLSEQDQAAAIKSGKPGVWPVQIGDALCDKLKVKGEHRHALMCITPAGGAHMLGRSRAWAAQKIFILDSLDPNKHQVLYTWRTPRPMNARFGPEEGVTLDGTVSYVILGKMYADYWIGSRTIADNDWKGDNGTGFRVMACCEDDSSDFHHAVCEFTW